MYSDFQLKLAFPKLYPYIHSDTVNLYWNGESDLDVRRVLDSELLHICQLIENSLNMDESYELGELYRIVGERGGHFTPNGWGCFELANLTWQQKLVCLAKIKKISLDEEK